MSEIWQKILIAAGSALVVGIIVMICDREGLFDRLFKKHKSKKEDTFTDKVRTVIKQEILPIKNELDTVKADLNVMKEGDMASLKNQLLTCYYRCEAKGFKTLDDAENYRNLLKCYHKLHGNSFIDGDITPNFDKIPLKNVPFQSGARIKEGK